MYIPYDGVYRLYNLLNSHLAQKTKRKKKKGKKHRLEQLMMMTTPTFIYCVCRVTGKPSLIFIFLALNLGQEYLVYLGIF